MYVCTWVITIASKQYIRLSWNWVCILQVTVGATIEILVSGGRIFFQHTLYMISHSLSNNQKFVVQCFLFYEILIPIDFGENRMHGNFIRVQKRNSYILRPMETNSLKCSSIQTVHWIDLKFGMHIKVHRPIYCLKFDELGINSFFTGLQQRILKHYSLWSQFIRSMLVSEWCFRLSLNFICALWVTVPCTILSLVWVGCIVFYRIHTQKKSYIASYRLKLFVSF